MKHRQFVRTLVEALVVVSLAGADLQGQTLAVDGATEFLEFQLAALPFVLRAGVGVGLLLFRLSAFARFGHGFRHISLAQRTRHVEAWASSRLAPCRQLVRATRNLALLSYFERLERLRSGQPVSRHATPTPGLNDSRRNSAAGYLALSSTPMRTEPVEVLVVGSGAGGSVTALELASSGYDVLVVEEGNPPEEDHIDPGATDTMAHLYRWRGMTPIQGHVPIAYVEGRCVGGSTEINSGFWHRPPVETLLRWKAQFDLADASHEELRPHWEWAEDMLGVGLYEGEWPASTRAFAHGATSMDWALHEVPRTAAHVRSTHRTGSRDDRRPGPGMSRSLLPRAVESGARILPSCRVEKLETRGDRVIAAHIRRRRVDGSSERVRIEAEHVFVCAGPTETPSLLRRSGVVHNIGDSLRIHPMLKVAASFPHVMDAATGSMPLLQVKEFWPEIVFGGAFFSPGHLAVVLADNWGDTRDRMQYADRMACYYVGVRGTGHGTVRPSRFEPERTVIRYELSDQDMWNLSRGLARLSTLLLEGGALEVLPAVRGLKAIRSEVDAVTWLDDRLDGGACSLTTVHAFSSCPMGERRDRCAADSFGKVFGYSNLYINDASMVPDSPGVNPQGTIMSLARRNAQRFCETYGRLPAPSRLAAVSVA